MAKLTSEEYKLLDRMNKRLRTWHKNNLSNNIINEVQNDLINFYSKYGIDNPSRDIILFKKSNKYTDEQKAEVLAIARAMENAKSSKLSYYKKHKTDDERFMKSYEAVKQNPAYNVNSFSDYIQFVDDMNNAKDIIAELMEIDSDMVARIYSYSREKKLTTNEINNIILDTVGKYRDGDDMEQFLMNEIDKKELQTHINVNLKDRLYRYGNKNNVDENAVDEIIENAILDRIPLDEIDNYLFNMIDEWSNKK